jgi:asparagine synthase (glutamine-hydrolysing)
VLFGSELKALRAHPAFRGDVDREALTAYARFGYVPAPRSIYAGIHKVPPGASVTFRAPGAPPECSFYWRADDAAIAGQRDRLDDVSDADAIEQLDVLLRDAVARRMIADVPLGAFLSGGIDSSTIVALMQAQSDRPVRTFTIGFNLERYDEAAAAKEVARHLGTDHTELYLTPRDALDVVPSLPRLFDEPFADSSQIPTYLVSRMARQHVTVALSGDGGDEAFGGYSRYFWTENIWRAMRPVPRPARALAAAGVTSVSAGAWNRMYGAVEWALPRGARVGQAGDKLYKLAALTGGATADDLYLRMVSQWKSPGSVVVGGHESPDPLGTEAARRVAPNFFERMMLLDTTSYLPDDILAKVDRASMGVSLEARAPLLDHRVIEWAWRLPLRFKVRDGQGKWILRQVLHRYVPKALVERPKMGFAVPIGPWLRTELREWAEHLLAPSRLRDEGFFDPARVREVWAAHQSGERNAEHPLWVVLMFQAWLESTR